MENHDFGHSSNRSEPSKSISKICYVARPIHHAELTSHTFFLSFSSLLVLNRFLSNFQKRVADSKFWSHTISVYRGVILPQLNDCYYAAIALHLFKWNEINRKTSCRFKLFKAKVCSKVLYQVSVW